MVERVCEKALKHLCKPIVERYNPPLVRLKGDKAEVPINPFKNFVDGEFGWFDTYIVRMSKPRAMCHDKCVAFFNQKSSFLCLIFLTQKYDGDLESAMTQTGKFEVLYQEFLNWFDDKRREFQMQFNVSEAKRQMLENGKRPSSHGGVANLLKTLTKTMEKQGASIQSIAKVQYTICMQAGIYIPDEFIEDVAVALSVMEDK